MLEREGSPSRYLTTEYCVKRPLYNSSTINILKQTLLNTSEEKKTSKGSRWSRKKKDSHEI